MKTLDFLMLIIAIIALNDIDLSNGFLDWAICICAITWLVLFIIRNVRKLFDGV